MLWDVVRLTLHILALAPAGVLIARDFQSHTSELVIALIILTSRARTKGDGLSLAREGLLWLQLTAVVIVTRDNRLHGVQYIVGLLLLWLTAPSARIGVDAAEHIVQHRCPALCSAEVQALAAADAYWAGGGSQLRATAAATGAPTFVAFHRSAEDTFLQSVAAVAGPGQIAPAVISSAPALLAPATQGPRIPARFASCDCERWPEAAAAANVDSGWLSVQMPSILKFVPSATRSGVGVRAGIKASTGADRRTEEGTTVEIRRLPYVNDDGSTNTSTLMCATAIRNNFEL
jgi:hypothetical protein